MNKIYKVWGISFFVLIFFALMLGNLNITETFYWINGRMLTWRNIVSCGFLGFGAVFVVMFAVQIILMARLKKLSAGKFLLSAFLAFISVIAMLFSAMYTDRDRNIYSPDYYEYSNNGQTIVICEESFLLGGWGTVYLINDNRTADEVGSFGTDDGHRNGGKYEIEWYDNSAVIHYYDGNDMRALEITLK